MEDIKELLREYSEQFAKHIGDDVDSFIDWFVDVSENKLIKSNPHPSDSDIESLAKFMHDEYERIAIEIGWDTQASCKVEFENLPKENKELMLLVAKSLRDRMNRETEHVLNDFLNGLLCRKDIHIKNPVCSNSIAEAINDYLQKFRNRDL